MARKKSPKHNADSGNVVEFGAPGVKPGSTSDPEAANELLAEAFDAPSDAQARKLAKQALVVDPDNVDARVMLAGLESTSAKRLERLEEAVAVGRKTIESLDAPPGMLSLDHDARPFLRALYSYATALMLNQQAAESIASFEELIRLDQRDSLGGRYDLIAFYLIADRLEDAKRVLTQYQEDESAALSWARTLLYYRLRDFKQARKHLEIAREHNPFVEDGLGDPEVLPEVGDDLYTPGSEAEADWILSRQGMAWMMNPHAVGWLSGELDPDHPDYVGPLNGLADIADASFDD